MVFCVPIHEALFELRNTFKIGTVFDPIDLAHQALVEWFGIEKPRIAVCGLNPHAGENGLFGDEEKRIIEPAIADGAAAWDRRHRPLRSGYGVHQGGAGAV